MEEFQPCLDLLTKKVMDDWLILSGGVLFVLFIVSIFYWLYNRNDESEFDTRYPRAALHLLTEDGKKKQQQQSGKKSNKKKADKPAVAATPSAARTPSAASTPSTQQPAGIQRQTSPPTVKTTPTPQQSKQQQKTPSQPAPEQPSTSAAATPATEEPAQQVQTVEPLQAEPPKEAKKVQPPKPINSSDLDQKKVMSYLTKKGDIDAAYTSWLQSAFQNHEQQMNNRKMETQSLDKKNKELVQRTEKLQKEKTAADNRAKEEQSQRLNVAAKLQALQNRETELVRQNQAAQSALHNRDQEQGKELQTIRARNQQIEGELNTLKANFNRTNGALRSAQQQARDAQNHFEEQARKHQSVVAAYEADKKKTNEKVEELKSVASFCEEQLSKTGNQFVAQAQQIHSLSTANNELKDALQAAHLALENNKLRTEDTAKLVEEQKQWQAEKEQMTEKYVRLEELIKELNGDMTEFHLYKDKQEKIVSELNQRDKSRLEEMAKEKEQSEAKEKDLLNQLTDTKQMLADVRKTLEAEQARIVEIPKNSEPEAVEEVFELKKTNVDLAAAPSTSSNDSRVEELSAKNAELNEKNMELRQRNMTILEKTEAVPNQLVDARKRVAAEIGKLTKKAFKSFNDEEAFYDWLSESVSDIEKSRASKATTSTVADAVASASVQKASKSTSAAEQVPAGNEQACRNALINLIKELDHINKLVDKQERAHAAELAKLRAQLA